jgi:hypothetical protein
VEFATVCHDIHSTILPDFTLIVNCINGLISKTYNCNYYYQSYIMIGPLNGRLTTFLQACTGHMFYNNIQQNQGVFGHTLLNHERAIGLPFPLQQSYRTFSSLTAFVTQERDFHMSTLSAVFPSGGCTCCILIWIVSCSVWRRDCEQITLLRTEAEHNNLLDLLSSSCYLPERQQDPIRCQSHRHVSMGAVPTSGPQILSWWRLLYSFCVYIREGGT